MMQGLTPKQQEVLDFIRDSIDNNGYPPAIREICVGVGLKSTSSVHKYIEDLVELGFLRKSATKKRALELIRDESQEKKKTFDVPVFGNVAAGLPIFADDNILDTFPLPMDFARKGELFILQIQGDSMIEAGIFDGDSIIVRKQDVAEDGDIVVALIDDSATVKRLSHQNGRIYLLPENSTMEPIIVDEVSILGKVIGLFRNFES